VWNREDKLIAADYFTVPQFNGINPVAVTEEVSHPRAKPNDDALAFEMRYEFPAIKFAERSGRNLHRPSVAMRKKGVDEHFAGLCDRDAIERFAQSTDEHHMPEAIDRVLGLPVPREPAIKRLTVQFCRIGFRECMETPSQGEPVSTIEVAQAPERPREMQRGGQRIRLQSIQDAVGPDKIQLAFNSKRRRKPGTSTEVAKVRAATKADMLTVINELAGRFIFERTRTAAEPRPCLEQRHSESFCR
jgi:hypothetical protein